MVRGCDPHDLAAEEGITTILMYLMSAMITSKYMTNMLGPNGTPNSGSNDESGLVKYGVKHFKHVSGALCTISQHHEG